MGFAFNRMTEVLVTQSTGFCAIFAICGYTQHAPLAIKIHYESINVGIALSNIHIIVAISQTVSH